MANENSQFPQDIPWEKLCVSNDMIDTEVCDRRFPYKWRSSVAIFSHEPPEEEQVDEDTVISYLKVVCTITGYQPDPKEVGLDDRKLFRAWNDSELIENYKEVVSRYYGCYGAILQVTVAPQGALSSNKVPLEDYPIFVDFHPKKREVFETVTDTGEVMSRSLDQVNIKKGQTTSDSQEVLDVFTGFNVSGKVGGYGGGFGLTGQWGTKDIHKEDFTNTRTSDRQEEYKETYSMTTNLTQMYHELTSYHLGTNRAVFFMLPRPHIVQSESTFVNGPRLLEGIQEFFLLVSRPKKIEKICVEAKLETAHIAQKPIIEYDKKQDTFSFHLSAFAEDRSGSCGDDGYTVVEEGSGSYPAPAGWEIDLQRSGGYHIESQSGERIEAVDITAAIDHVSVYGRVSSKFVDNVFNNYTLPGRLDLTISIYLKKKTGTVVGYENGLFLTGRHICCCGGIFKPVFPGDWVVWESVLNPKVTRELNVKNQMSIIDANLIRAEIKKELHKSINHFERHPYGEIKFIDTKFMGDLVASFIGEQSHPDNVVIGKLPGLDNDLKRKAEKIHAMVPRSRLLKAPIQELKDRFGLKPEQAIQLRRAAMGLAGESPDPKERWDPKGSPHGRSQIVPNVIGFSKKDAQHALRKHNLYIDDVVYKDSEQPRDTVLSQHPKPGEKAYTGARVDLVLATGLSVMIPDIIGLPLTKALRRLDDAGLESEPKIMFNPSDEQPENHIILVTPEPRTYITPNATVVLEVSSK